MFTPSVNSIAMAVEAKGFKVFRGGPHDLNIVGIRSAAARLDQFDDLITVFSRHQNQWLYWAFPATTDPGAHYLEHPINEAGTAILAPGQYRGAYRIGKHRGEYLALVQARPVTVFRDKNRNRQVDTGQITETGLFGLNIHRAAWDGKSTVVGAWSAGCQVIQSSLDFDIFMAMANAGKAAYGNAFTYTLIEETDLT